MRASTGMAAFRATLIPAAVGGTKIRPKRHTAFVRRLPLPAGHADICGRKPSIILNGQPGDLLIVCFAQRDNIPLVAILFLHVGADKVPVCAESDTTRRRVVSVAVWCIPLPVCKPTIAMTKIVGCSIDVLQNHAGLQVRFGRKWAEQSALWSYHTTYLGLRLLQCPRVPQISSRLIATCD